VLRNERRYGAPGRLEGCERCGRRHAGAVFALSPRLLADRVAAEELVQDIFLRLWHQPERFDPERGSLRSYLLAQTYGRSIDILRSDVARRRREEREAVTGHLRDRRAAALPVVAAVGGMVVPALIYLAVNPRGEAAQGWGIPMATDIAFALGVLALLARGLPSSLKPFLLTLAIVDDIGAILVIAVFYSHGGSESPREQEGDGGRTGVC
jgi:RNA polymerase sigma factor (sigma-70 family)